MSAADKFLFFGLAYAYLDPYLLMLAMLRFLDWFLDWTIDQMETD